MTIDSSPEKYGLTLVKDHNACAGSYEFDTILVLRDRHGQHYALHDAGCSCPEPFEGKGVDDLTPINSLAELDRFARAAWRHLDNELEGHVAQLVDLPAAVARVIPAGGER